MPLTGLFYQRLFLFKVLLIIFYRAKLFLTMVKIAFNFFVGFAALSFFATNLTIHVTKNATNLTILYAIFATFPFFAKK